MLALAFVGCLFITYRFRSLKAIKSNRNNGFSRAILSDENKSVVTYHGRQCVQALDPQVQKSTNRLIQRILEIYVESWHSMIRDPQISFKSFNITSDISAQIDLTVLWSTNLLRNAFFSPHKNELTSRSVFLLVLQELLCEVFAKIISALQNIEWNSLVMTRIVPILSHHVRYFKQASTLLSQYGTRNLTKSEELDVAIASLYRDGDLHRAIVGPERRLLSGSSPFELDFWRPIASRIIEETLPVREKNSHILRPLLSEILATCIFQPTISMLSDPDYWNQTIDIYLTRLISEQRMVNKLREALEKPFINPTLTPPAENSAVHRPPTFEEYLRHIKNCNNLFDARRIHHSIIAEISKKKAQQNELDSDNYRKYLNRLNVARKRAEKRILQLGGGKSEIKGRSWLTSFDHKPFPKEHMENVTLESVLQEPALSYFREFVDRELQLPVLHLVLTVGAVFSQITRKILERSVLVGGNVDVEQLIGLIKDSLFKSSLSLAELKEWQLDMQTLVETFFSKPDPLILSVIGRPLIENLREVSSDILHRIEPAVDDFESPELMLSEKFVPMITYISSSYGNACNHMNRVVLPRFKDSDIFYRMIADSALSDATTAAPYPYAPYCTEETSPDSSTRGISENIERGTKGLLNGVKRPLSLLRNNFAGTSIDEPVDINNIIAASPNPQENNIDKSDSGSDQAAVFESEAVVGDKGSLDGPKGVFYDAFAAVEEALKSIVNANPISDDKNTAFVDKGTKNGDEEESDECSSVTAISESGSNTDYSTSFVDASEQFSNQADPSLLSNDMQNIPDPIAGVEAVHQRLKNLEEEISRIENQERLLNMYRQKNEREISPEHRVSSKEFKIMQKMQWQLERDKKALLLQRTNLILESNENLIIPGQTVIRISSWASTNGDQQRIKDSSKNGFAVFVIEIDRKSSVDRAELEPASGWMIARRYSEFHLLHKVLKQKYPAIMSKPGIELPGKRYLFHLTSGVAGGRIKSKLQKTAAVLMALPSPHFNSADSIPEGIDQRHGEFMETRRAALEKYLNFLVTDPELSKSIELRHFLCQDKFDLLPIGTLKDQDIGGRFKRMLSGGDSIESLSRNKTESKWDTFTNRLTRAFSPNLIDTDESQQERKSSTSQEIPNDVLSLGQQISSVTEPLCDLFIEIFELYEKNNWLRRQAVQILLQQIFEGAIERRLEDTIKWASNAEMLSWYLENIMHSLVPIDSAINNFRSIHQKTQSKLHAYRKLHVYMPDLFGPVVGRSNAKKGASNIWDVFQNRILNQEWLYRSVDEIFPVLISELSQK